MHLHLASRREWERLLLNDPILVAEFAALDAEEEDIASRRRAAIRRARRRVGASVGDADYPVGDPGSGPASP